MPWVSVSTAILVATCMLHLPVRHLPTLEVAVAVVAALAIITTTIVGVAAERFTFPFPPAEEPLAEELAEGGPAEEGLAAARPRT